MIYLTGDTHGEFERLEELFAIADCDGSDVLIILGDAGINYYGTPHDREAKQQLSELPFTLLCIHGNHEQRPETISSYEETEWCGGTVYFEREFPNLLFAKDGEIFELEGMRCIAIGGAYSVDKYYRLAQGAPWWEDEQPSDEIMQRVETRLSAEKWRIDVVLSHTCPMKYIPQEAFLPSINQDAVDNSTEQWLDSIEERLTYKRWYCGHFHVDKSIGNVRFMYEEFLDLY